MAVKLSCEIGCGWFIIYRGFCIYLNIYVNLVSPCPIVGIYPKHILVSWITGCPLSESLTNTVPPQLEPLQSQFTELGRVGLLQNLSKFFTLIFTYFVHFKDFPYTQKASAGNGMYFWELWVISLVPKALFDNFIEDGLSAIWINC